MKIIRKKFINDNRNYYDLSIEGTHNFCLADGEVVHNTGVGYSIQTHHIEKLPDIRKPNYNRKRKYVIQDSIIGWSDAVKVLFKSYTGKINSHIQFDFSDIREKGALLITAGGRAPGPEPLRLALTKIEGMLREKEDNTKLTSLQAHDIMCHIADAVLAGGIRRAAMIALFNLDDTAMLSCKTGDWYVRNPQRGRANNSAVILRHKITKSKFHDLWERMKESGAGEPGIYFTNDMEYGTNPCITGDALITVKDVGISETDDEIAIGVPYQIPMKLLIERFDSGGIMPYVLSYNEETEKTEWDIIDMGALTREDTDVIELELEDGEMIKMTPDHKVFTKNRGYVNAADLTNEDILLKID